ncbi:uncharacterized protein LOC113848406 [Abrus precatorius]|uniref:Uncharacterized protein LOC113848406 n=1 Tax=Abrus precatorius TaxID=3816 RepID=A0A8B8JQG3_ABRPR|nr:uncharacterized protein LOC113848406 [Abrus precatorius]
MPFQIPKRRVQKKLWRVLGFLSSVIGLICYALSSSFKHIFGEWNLLKITLYTMVSFCISSMMLFLKTWNLSKSFLMKAHVGVLVLLLTSFYSFVYDKDENGKPDLLSLISCGALAFMSLCLSRQIDLGFEADLLNFFLGCLTVQLMMINLMLSIVAAIFCYCLMVLRSKFESKTHVGTRRMEDHVNIDIDAAEEVEREADDNTSVLQSQYSNSHQQSQGLRRRVGDGYNWKKYEVKLVKGGENQISYYKCAQPNCTVKKKVVNTIEGQIVETRYRSIHNHYKPADSLKRNPSSEYFYSLLPSEPVPTDLPDASYSKRQLEIHKLKSSISI